MKTLKMLVSIVLFGLLVGGSCGQVPVRRNAPTKSRIHEKSGVMKDAFLEDNSFVLKIRTTYNFSSSITCNAVLLEDNLVLSDVTCIKYNNMANIDAKYVQVVTMNENNSEVNYDVEQIYINKADPKDPGTELAVLKLVKPIKNETNCKSLLKPERNFSIEIDTPVRVIGYTHWYDLKENRTRIARRPLNPNHNNKYYCTTPADMNETPGSQLLRGAPLMSMVDCKQYMLVGIYTVTNEISLPNASRKHQDCFVMVAPQIKWVEQVRTLSTSSLAAKNENGAVVVVTVDDDKEPREASLANN